LIIDQLLQLDNIKISNLLGEKMTRQEEERKRTQRYWDAIRKEFQAELWKRAEVVKQWTETRIRPTNITLILEDNDGNIRKFKLISIRGRGGVLGEPLKLDQEYVDTLIKKYKKVYPYISKIDFFEKPYFPFSKDDDLVKFSPIFVLTYNKGYKKDKIGPYNVEMAGFLINYFPKSGIFLEAVTKSVAGTIAVIENIMKRHNEPYTRKNHLLNWLYFLISPDSFKLNIQIFNMQKRYMQNFVEYIKSLNEEKKSK